MRKKTTALLTGLLLLLACTNIALAVEIPISITVPAIPGVTVPLIEEQTMQNSTPAQGNSVTPQETSAATQKIETEKNTTLIEQQVQQEKVLIFVKTFYER